MYSDLLEHESRRKKKVGERNKAHNSLHQKLEGPVFGTAAIHSKSCREKMLL